VSVALRHPVSSAPLPPLGMAMPVVFRRFEVWPTSSPTCWPSTARVFYAAARLICSCFDIENLPRLLNNQSPSRCPACR
jgi:hypothetical protein